MSSGYDLYVIINEVIFILISFSLSASCSVSSCITCTEPDICSQCVSGYEESDGQCQRKGDASYFKSQITFGCIIKELLVK